MAQVESLVLEVRSNEVSQASRRLDRLGRSAQSTERASGRLANSNRGLASSFKRTIPVLLAAGAAAASFRKALDIGVATQDFKARLKTATGSVEDANAAFEALEDFATRTPYALEQSLEAFTKLTNLGLTPSERALESYGNTAAAMGKDLTQLIEAVADATTNEFERLKEFGIKTKQQGDQVSFTFRGVTKTIGKNAEEIERYLMDLGENEFAGAMADRMDTLGGKVSNLGDSWNQLWRTINDAGVGELLENSIQKGIDVIGRLNDSLQSGEFEAHFDSWTIAIQEWLDDFEGAILQASEMTGVAIESQSGPIDNFINNLKLMPVALKASFDRLSVELLFLFGQSIEFVKTLAKSMWLGLKTQFDSIIEYAKRVAKALNPKNLMDGSFVGDLKNAWEDAAAARVVAEEDAQKRINRIWSAYDSNREVTDELRKLSIQEIELEWASSYETVMGLEEKLEKIREKNDKKNLEREKMKAARKAFDLALNPPSSPVSQIPSGVGSGKKEKEEFERLVDQLRAEERALEGSYLKRLEIVRKNTVAGSEIRAEMEEKLRQEYEKNVSSFEDRKIRELDFQRSNWQLELDELKDFYARRHEIIMDAESLTGEERNKMIAELEREKNDLIAQMEQERMMQGLETAKNMFGNYAKLAQSNNKTLSKIGQAALKAQKAVAITQAIIDTYKSANAAYSAMAGIPVVGPALGVAAAGAAVAAGIANVAAIRAAPVGGSFEHGGIVPGTSFSGDNVVANVNSGEMILNKQQQAKLFDIANRGGSGGITIINQTTGRIDKAETVMLPNGERQIIIQEAVEATEAKLTKDSNYGGGSFVPSLTRNFGMQRTA